MALYEVHGRVTITGTAFLEQDDPPTAQDYEIVLKRVLTGGTDRAVQYSEVEQTEVVVVGCGETDEIYTTIR